MIPVLEFGPALLHSKKVAQSSCRVIRGQKKTMGSNFETPFIRKRHGNRPKHRASMVRFKIATDNQRLQKNS